MYHIILSLLCKLYRAAAIEIVGKSFEQLGNNQNYLNLSDSF